MTFFSIKHFDRLKELLLQKSGYVDISPAVCKALSIAIFRGTNQQISETTLKRIYGFAYSKFKPSLFTLNALSKFCGFSSWSDFCDNDNISNPNPEKVDICWESVKNSAHKITNFTLQVLKNKSGIPYSQTIKRKFIEEHFDVFLSRNYIATALVAPAGYGKTMALCHWIEERLLLNESNDIILFFSSNALINIFLSGKDINEWILSLLGYSTENVFSTILDSNKKHDGNFYLVVDGLDEHMFKSEQFDLLFDQILNIFSFYQFHSSFKLLLTMRPATWINHKYKVENLTEKWFDGFVSRNDQVINVPLFNIKEIRELCAKINPSIQNIIGIAVAENFNHPLYFQFYYQQHKQDFSLNNVDHVSIYELISVFILNKIYLGPHAAEKTLIIKELVEAMDFSAGIFDVHKYVLNDTIRKYSTAYNDLLGIGFIREVNKSTDMRYNAVIEFCNDNLLNYSLTRALLFKHSNQFDLSLINELNSLFDSERKLQILKWSIVYAVKNGQQESFNLLAQTSLVAKDKSELILFLGDMLEKVCISANKTDAMIQYFKQDSAENLFNYFFGLELIDGAHEKALQTLLKFGLTTEKQIYVYTGLAMIAIKQLDLRKLEEQIISLKKCGHKEIQGLAVNPLNCLETIYYYCKFGVLKKDAVAELTKFYFLPPQSTDYFEYRGTNEMLYLLGLYTLAICNKPYKVLRVINVLEKTPQYTSAYTGFTFLLTVMAAEAYIALNKIEDANNLYYGLVMRYDDEKGSFTTFMEASFFALRAKIQMYNTEKTSMEIITKLLTCLSKQSDFKLIQLQTLFFILNNKQLLKASDAHMKNIFYEFTKLMRASDFSEEVFQKFTVSVAI